ncbi:MAG: response regulator transcription factor [Myxococcota bacterium]
MNSPIHSLVIPRPLHVLLVDDDPEVVTALKRMLRAAEPEWLISTANNGREALAFVNRQTVDVLVTDLHMPVMDGFQLLAQLARSHPETIRIVHSSHTATLATELLRYLAHNVLTKPTPAPEILALLRWAVRSSGSVRRHEAREG